MFPAQITYHRAGSVAEAVQLLSSNEGAKLLAGGHSLLPLMKLRLAAPAVLVDIGRIEALKGVSASGGGITIGALTTHAEIASSDLVKQHAPVLAEAAALVGDPAVRNRGTIGGSVSHADPASDQPTVLTALGATFNVTGQGGDRSIAAGDFATGLLENALEENEVLTSISVPSVPSGAGSAYVKFPHPASRYAVVGAAAVVAVSGGTCSSASVVVGGVETTPARASSVEAALAGSDLGDAALDAAAAAVGGDLNGDPMGDVFASAEYRRAMAAVYVRRALGAAASRAG
ncbi:MAG: xanthine dehydrogenase family protein subunit M [Chloroflexota bacterium]|nr:xanthine dehydrogenase family protein subunit M [Chloroflexota bacterium]MDE2886262.1 xanthine dehydrogenase family protein subunit M [Chloroflexota bacterium]